MNLTENAIKVLKKDILRRMKTEICWKTRRECSEELPGLLHLLTKSMSQRKSLKV